MNASFPFGVIAQHDDVVDRKDYIRDMVIRMESGQSAIIAGPRRIGKSSVGREILRQMHDRGHYTAAVDLFAANSMDGFVAQLTESILANRTGLLRRSIRSLDGLRKLIGTAEIKAKLGDVEIGMNWSDTDDAHADNLLRALTLAESLAEKDGCRMVILLDEFQDIERIGSPNLLKQFRAVAQLQKHTTYLFLGSQPSLMRTLFANQRQAFYRFATFCPLPEIPHDAWAAYIENKFENGGLSVTPTAMNLILDRTGGHPYGVMGLLFNAYAMATAAGANRVDADMIASAEEQLLNHLDGIFSQQWLDVRRVKYADAACTAICEMRPPYAMSAPRSSIARALRHLQDLGIIEKRSDRGAYTVVEQMFGRWLRERLK